MTPAKPRLSDNKKLDKLRVIVADAINCYGVNRDSEPTDISANAAAHELYGQYSLRLLLNWLATRYGFPIYKSDVNPGFHADRDVLGTWQNLSNRYPLNTPDAISLPESAWAEAFAHLDASFDPNLELIGRLYMHLLSDRTRGEFYTPAWLVDYCVSLLPAPSVDAGHRILDPACGSGNFLLGTLRRARGEMNGGQLISYAANSLYGNDIDGCATSLARFSILLALAGELRNDSNQVQPLLAQLDQHIRISDSITASAGAEGFTAVVGNPPYVSFGARNQAAISAGWSRFLRTTFDASAEYKIRLHSIFQEIALNLVRTEGDVVLLVPDAFLNGAYYKKLRRLIAQQAQIVTLCELPASTFPDAVVGKWCVAHYRKGSQQGPVRLQRLATKPAEQAIFHEFVADADDVIASNDKFRFNLVFNDNDLSLLRLMKHNARLGEMMRGHTGIRARNGQRSIVSEQAGGTNWRRGLTSGSCVRPHRVEWDQKWLNIEPNKLYAGGFDENIIERPKILMRQTADRIIAAIDREGLYHLNNIHSFAADRDVEAAEHWLYFCSGLMNSSFWTYLYQLKTRERKRALAQIDIETIESMPLPAHDMKTETTIAALVKQSIDTEAAEEFADIQQCIDKYVFDIYGIPTELRLHISSNLNMR